MEEQSETPREGVGIQDYTNNFFCEFEVDAYYLRVWFCKREGVNEEKSSVCVAFGRNVSFKVSEDELSHGKCVERVYLHSLWEASGREYVACYTIIREKKCTLTNEFFIKSWLSLAALTALAFLTLLVYLFLYKIVNFSPEADQCCNFSTIILWMFFSITAWF